MSRPPTPLIERILAKLDSEGPCWIWLGATHRGYGQVGSGGKRGRILYVHRAMWEELVGPIPGAMQLDHLCKVTRCCNPDHLQPVTSAENTRRSSAGLATGARNRAKVACPAGHPYDEQNTRHTNKGRSCRACDRDRYQARKAAQ